MKKALDYMLDILMNIYIDYKYKRLFFDNFKEES